MSGFRKAKAEQAALKVGIYGLAGSGKTLTTLLFLEGLANITKKRFAFVDTERGTDFYAQEVKERTVHPKAFDFDALYTRSIAETMDALESLDPEKYCGVAIDSITHIWEAAIAAFDGEMTKIGTIPFNAWGKIKKPYKEIMTFLLNSPLHVFIVGRLANEFSKDEETEELTRVGVKMKAEGETPYEPHILIRMEGVKPKEKTKRRAATPGMITAYAEKDRTGILSGRTFVNPTYETVIKPLLGLLGSTQGKIASTDETATKDSDRISSKETAKELSGDLIVRKFQAKFLMCGTHEELATVGKEITPEVKKKLSSLQVKELKRLYAEAEAQLKPAATPAPAAAEEK